MLRTFNLHNKNAGTQNICLINNQVTYPFFISNEYIDFSESIWIFLPSFDVYENTVFETKLPCNF